MFLISYVNSPAPGRTNSILITVPHSSKLPEKEYPIYHNDYLGEIEIITCHVSSSKQNSLGGR
jgi:hypothetical protein